MAVRFDIEMLKSCCECDVWSKAIGEDGADYDCELINEINTKPDWCPLKEVVTCGECKHWYQNADTGMACEYTNLSQPEDGSCNWGERK